MKKIRLLLMLVLVSLCSVSALAKEKGTIENPSFEIWETAEGLDGWTKSEDTTEGAVSVAWSEKDEQDGNYSMSCWSDKDYYVNVYQDIEGLEPGYYYLTAYAQNGGGQDTCYLYAGGSKQSYSTTLIPVSEGGVTQGWRLVTVRGITVEADGTARIGVCTDANAGNWMKLDNLQLIREKDQDAPYQFLKGGDISELTWLEEEGAVYYDAEGNPKDALQILADNGWNFARLRLYNSPGKGNGDGTYYCKEGYQDEEDILSLAKRAADKGMELELSFHYSDYWSNGTTQIIPREWQEQIDGMAENEAVDKLCDLVYDYTYDVMKKMEKQGTVPAYVSLGNEIQSGILFPYGKASAENWKYLARFLTSGSRAVTDASPQTKVIIHLDDAGNYSKYTSFFDNCEKFGVPYDIIGPSYYPFWTDKDVDTIVAFCNDMVERYDKDILIMETGYNFNQFLPNGMPGQLSDNGCYSHEGTYGSSPEGQKNFMIDLFNGLKTVKDGRCIGDLYWDPIMVEQDGVGWAMLEASDEPDVNAVANTTLFDFEHKLLPVADVYRNSQIGDENGNISGRLVKSSDVTSGIGKISGSIWLGEKEYPIVTDKYGYFYLEEIPDGIYTVDVSVEGMEYNRDVTEIEIKKGITTSLEFKVTGAFVTGKVTDDRMVPVKDAVIYAEDGARTFKTNANEEGVYNLQDIPAGNWQIWAEANGYDSSEKIEKSLMVGDSVENIDFQISLNSGSIEGTITDSDGNSIADARVCAELDGIQTVATSDANGHYRLQYLKSEEDKPRIYKIIVSKQGYLSEVYQIEVLLGQTVQAPEIVLKRDIGSLVGSVIDSEGNPVEHASIDVIGSDTYKIFTDADGKYIQNDMQSGSWTVKASKDGYMGSITQSVEIKYGEETNAPVIVLPLPISVENGSFELPKNPEDEWDKSPAGWQINATSNDTNGVCALRQDRTTFGGTYDGRFGFALWLDEAFQADVYQEINDLKPGNYLLRAQVYSGITKEFYMYAKDSNGNIIGKADILPNGGFTEVNLLFELEGTTCTIGFYTDTSGTDWGVIDLVEMGYWGPKEGEEEKPLSVMYRTHVQNKGWQDYASDGAMSGTRGQGLRLEAIEVNLLNTEEGGIEYRTHVQNEGWQDYVADGVMSGTKGKSLRLEAIQIRLTGAVAETYDIYYRTHIQDKGWLGWAVNDGKSGSAGLSKRLEAIEIRLVEKGGPAPGSTDNTYLTNQKEANPTISYCTHVQNEGWQNIVSDGMMSGTKGKSLRLEAIEINVDGDGFDGGVEYSTHVQNEGWQDYVTDGMMSGTKGKSLRLEAIKIRLTGVLAQKYSVEYRTHVQNEGWQSWVRDDAMSGTKGKSLRLEAIEIRLVKR